MSCDRRKVHLKHRNYRAILRPSLTGRTVPLCVPLCARRLRKICDEHRPGTCMMENSERLAGSSPASTSGRPFTTIIRPNRPRPQPKDRVVASAGAGERKGELTLLDYGAGNVRSVRNAVRSLGYTLKEVRLL